MKEVLLQYSLYHLWANQLLLEVINALPEEKQKQEVASSFPGLYKTLLHMWDAESIWWQRMKLCEHVVAPSVSFNGSTKEVSMALLHQNHQWADWLQHTQEYALQHVFHYQNSKKEQFKQPLYQMLLHLFNHGTYHRGQLVNILRQLGVEKLPPTDFIIWSRKK